MADFLEVWRPGGMAIVALEGQRITIGKAQVNDVSLAGDRTASRMHATLERYPAGWSIKDLGSRNGTFVNGERVLAERRLLSGDEIRVGGTRLVYRAVSSSSPDTVTEAAEAPPELTRRERDVLVGLCKPVLSGDVFTEPSSIRGIAETLVVTEAAVKQHLVNLYAKFGVADGEHRRVRLANEAIRRGAVSIADLRSPKA